MPYERDLDEFANVYDPHELGALIRAFAWLGESRKRTLCLPDREMNAPGMATLQGANRAHIRAGGATRLRNFRLYMLGCYDCQIDRLSFLATAPIPESAITIQTSAGQPTGQNQWNNIRVEGPYARSVEYKDTQNLGNNDFDVWENLTSYGNTVEQVLIESPMSVGIEFRNAYLSSGKYGINSKGAYIWRGGRMSGHTVSDLAQPSTNSVAGCITVEGLNSEMGARLYTNYSPAEGGNGTVVGTSQVTGIPVHFKGVRFALDNAAIDASENFDGSGYQYGVLPTGDRIGLAIPINCGFRGPYVVESCFFLHGLKDNVNGAKRVKFRLAGGGVSPDKGGEVRSCLIATNNVNAALLDSGEARNNLGYLYTSDTWQWFPNHCP